MSAKSKTSKLWLWFGGLLVVLLLAAVFTLGSLNIPFEPNEPREVLILFALSTFIVAALLVFGLILTRNLLKLWAERRAEKLGARFRTKMVLGAMAISLLPVIFMFIASYALMNRTLAKWFPRPLEIATEKSEQLQGYITKAEQARLARIALRIATGYKREGRQGDILGTEGPLGEGRDDVWTADQKEMERLLGEGADAVWTLDQKGKVRAGFRFFWTSRIDRDLMSMPDAVPSFVSSFPNGLEIWRVSTPLTRVDPYQIRPWTYLASRAPYPEGTIVVGIRVPNDFLQVRDDLGTQLASYEAQKQGLRTYKTQILLVLLLFTLLLLFSSMWFAMFLSKQVTVPIQALAEATQEVSHGNFAHRVDVQAQDELGILVQSFNQMTAQLSQSREQIDVFTRNLQQAVQELERRRKLIEAIVENIPTGVISLDESGKIGRMNAAMARIFGEGAREAHTPAELLGEEAARNVQQLMRKSLRMGTASKEIEIALPDRVLHAGVTVSSLGPRSANPGYVLVIDDLTELLRAQKAAAWQEVAQRIAHEIKNPLTPIQLSAQRLTRFLEKEREGQAGRPVLPGELSALVGECATMIEREVSTLKALVDEFSQFARFPTAKPVPADINSIVASALDVFSGRLEGMKVRSELARDLPAVKADPELMRRVVINLIDNAAEAMEGSTVKELSLSTRAGADGEAVEVVVADSGHGIPPEDKDKLFLPRFSTRDRGTGLGLAIASRIVADHHGSIRVEDNQPFGARFVVRVPLAEVSAGAPNDAGMDAGGTG